MGRERHICWECLTHGAFIPYIYCEAQSPEVRISLLPLFHVPWGHYTIVYIYIPIYLRALVSIANMEKELTVTDMEGF